jgi:DNA-binding beta-propeller fold protein YncE
MTATLSKIRILALSMLLVGCASNMNDDSVQDTGPLPQWPAAPRAPRISYLYSVTTPEDAKIDRGFLDRAWQFVKGGEAETISRPQGVHVDSAGRLYVVDTEQRRIHVFDARSSDYSWFPKEPILDFEYPVDVAADGNGRIYVSDSSTNVIHVFDSFGKEHLRTVGEDELTRPTGLAIRPESHELLVVDTLASSLLVFDTRNFEIKTRVGRNGRQPDALHYPTNIALAPDGSVCITDALNFRIQILGPALGFQGHFGEAGDGPGFFSRPKGIAVDSDQNIYVVDALFDNVQVFNRNGDLLLAFGSSGHAAGEFWLPNDIFIDADDLIYVADSYNSRVQVFRYHSQAMN